MSTVKRDLEVTNRQSIEVWVCDHCGKELRPSGQDKFGPFHEYMCPFSWIMLVDRTRGLQGMLKTGTAEPGFIHLCSYACASAYTTARAQEL